MLLFAEVHALARFEPLDVEAREVAVIRLLAGVEIDAIRRPIRESALLDVGDERDLLWDVFCRARQDRRWLDVEEFQVGQKGVGIELRDLPRSLAGSARAFFHLVLAGVGVGRQMTDVGNVHYVVDTIAVPFERAAQHVLENERPVVADVLVVVDGGTARVEADRAALVERLERTQRPRVVVVERERFRHDREMKKPPGKARRL